jgi:hypothetical protein
MRKAIIVVLVLGVAGAGLVGADYYGLFGVRRVWSREFLSVRFLPVDSRSGKPVTGVHLNCTLGATAHKLHSERPCTQRGDDSDGVVLAQFVLVRQRRHTLLFDKGAVPSESLRGKVTLVFIHPDYQRLFIPVPFSALPVMQGRDNKVILVPAVDDQG